MNQISAGVSAEADARRKEVSEGGNGSRIDGAEKWRIRTCRMSTGRNRHLSDAQRTCDLADRRSWKHGGGLAPEPLCDARRVKPYVVADSNIGDCLSLDEIVDRRSPET